MESIWYPYFERLETQVTRSFRNDFMAFPLYKFMWPWDTQSLFEIINRCQYLVMFVTEITGARICDNKTGSVLVP